MIQFVYGRTNDHQQSTPTALEVDNDRYVFTL